MTHPGRRPRDQRMRRIRLVESVVTHRRLLFHSAPVDVLAMEQFQRHPDLGELFMHRVPIRLHEHTLVLAAAALRTRSTKASRARKQTGNDILIPSWQELTELALNPAERADRLLIMLMAWGGLRWSEAIGLDVQSLNAEAGTIAVTQVFVKSETRGWVIEPVKAGVSESVSAPTRLMTALLDHADGHPHERNSLTGRLLFRAPRPKPGSHELLDLSNWTRNVFKPARIAAGLNGDMTRPTLDPRRRHLTPKDLRASAASFLIDAGASRLETSAHLRHGDPRTTDRYYSRPLESQHHLPARASIRANTALSLPERLSAMFEAWIETDPERLKSGLM